MGLASAHCSLHLSFSAKWWSVESQLTVDLRHKNCSIQSTNILIPAMVLLHSSSHFSTVRWTRSSHRISATPRAPILQRKVSSLHPCDFLVFLGKFMCVFDAFFYFILFLPLGPICHCRCRMRSIRKSLKRLSMWCRELVVYALT